MYTLTKGILILEPLSSWTQTEIEEKVEETRVRRIPKLIYQGKVYPKIKGNTLNGAHRDGVIRFIESLAKDDLVKIMKTNPLSAAILLTGAPFMSLEYNSELREIAYSDPFIRFFGLGIAPWLPQRKISFTDAVPVFKEFSRIASMYSEVSEILREYKVELPEVTESPDTIIVKQVIRRRPLKEIYYEHGLPYVEENGEKDPFRGIKIEEEVCIVLTPLLSLVELEQLAPLSEEELGILLTGIVNMRRIGPKKNKFNVHSIVWVEDEDGREEMLVVIRNYGEKPILNKEAKVYVEKFRKWILSGQLFSDVLRISEVLTAKKKKKR